MAASIESLIDDARRADTIEAVFWRETRTPGQAVLDWLTGQGVPPTSLARDADGNGFVIAAAHATFKPDAPRFEFARQGDPALTFVARDRCGDPCDLVAWSRRQGRVASLFGRCGLIGFENASQPRLAGPLRLHRDALEWLRAGRDGILLIDPARAGGDLLLLDEKIEAADADVAALGQALIDAAVVRGPRIVIAGQRARGVAA